MKEIGEEKKLKDKKDWSTNFQSHLTLKSFISHTTHKHLCVSINTSVVGPLLLLMVFVRVGNPCCISSWYQLQENSGNNLKRVFQLECWNVF